MLPGSCVAARNWFLAGCKTDGLISLPVVGRRLPWVLCHMGLPNVATCFIKASKGERLLGRQKLQSYVT